MMVLRESTLFPSLPSPEVFVCLIYIDQLVFFWKMKSSQPCLSPFINHLSLDLAHLCIDIPHCPHGDDEGSPNDAILEDFVLGG